MGAPVTPNTHTYNSSMKKRRKKKELKNKSQVYAHDACIHAHISWLTRI